MKVYYHKPFIKKLRKLTAKLRQQAVSRLALFADNPNHPKLENHALKGKYRGMRSINMTGDYRAIFRCESDDVCLFVDIDNHNNLYS
ncbi:MAG: hypothetical protein A3C90_04160 [Candidatus Magasanikbacteria bacterium RIFCSPHIGHO2_02_FULL_51_14]|uniref:Plasmid stabilization protein n=1 Tax=Candidatus Magasanikbacteria bacterium RIFCSPHIGHO2_02_FULL_51_14 TaxID=1798683 RepID=A0A1F6MD85_9BACT|nr:MAG: hypothetical protein A3C90_04160 [Candidatus Magasanikbacteria bacterium RIFCSPHIGHO2_02_FULL_51_14]